MLDFCFNKPDGLQADPVDCRAYYDCVKGKTRHRTGLSVGLMLDPETREFRHSDKVNCTVRKGEFKPKKSLCNNENIKPGNNCICSYSMKKS